MSATMYPVPYASFIGPFGYRLPNGPALGLPNNLLFSYSPIDIILSSWTLQYWSGGSGSFSLALWQNGATLGPTLSGPQLTKIWQQFDTPYTIPAVTSGGIATARFGWLSSPAFFNFASAVALGYLPANVADTGKIVLGIGQPGLVTGSVFSDLTTSPGLGSSEFGQFGSTYDWSGPIEALNGAQYFNCSCETMAQWIAGAQAGDGRSPAAHVWSSPGTIQDVTLVCDMPGGADGTYTFILRQNQADTAQVVTITTGGTVATVAGNPSTVVNPSDLVCWRNSVKAGGTFAGQLLWTFRLGPPLDTGYGSGGYGDGGYGG